MRTPFDCTICEVGKILWWSSTLSAVVGHWPTSNCSNMVAGQCWRHPPAPTSPIPNPSSFTPSEPILQAWPEPLHVLLLIPEWTIAHKIGPFMHLRSLHKDGSLAPFSQGFIWLEGFLSEVYRQSLGHLYYTLIVDWREQSSLRTKCRTSALRKERSTFLSQTDPRDLYRLILDKSSRHSGFSSPK